MELRTEATIDHPRDAVFRVYRDELVDLVPFLPNVRGIEVKRREEKGVQEIAEEALRRN